jgi:glycine cleavage system aminomethyltransferase T
VGLRLNRDVGSHRSLKIDGKMVGFITSTAISPLFDSIALAVIKRPYYQQGNVLLVGEDINLDQKALVTELPFDSRHLPSVKN